VGILKNSKAQKTKHSLLFFFSLAIHVRYLPVSMRYHEKRILNVKSIPVFMLDKALGCGLF
jgi:hypothetical protein